MDDQTLKQAVLAQCFEADGKTRLRCADALQIAEAQGTKPSEIGRICNENGIKIVACELGCFK